MVCILPTTDELDAACKRAGLGDSFNAVCAGSLDTGYEPVFDERVIGRHDARLLADAFDLYMRTTGSSMRAVRIKADTVGFWQSKAARQRDVIARLQAKVRMLTHDKAQLMRDLRKARAS